MTAINEATEPIHQHSGQMEGATEPIHHHFGKVDGKQVMHLCLCFIFILRKEKDGHMLSIRIYVRKEIYKPIFEKKQTKLPKNRLFQRKTDHFGPVFSKKSVKQTKVC